MHVCLVLKACADKQTKESVLGLKTFVDKRKCVYLGACADERTRGSVYASF